MGTATWDYREQETRLRPRGAKAPPRLTNGTMPSPALSGSCALTPETPGYSGEVNSGQGVLGGREGTSCDNRVQGPQRVVQNNKLKSWSEAWPFKMCKQR